MTRILAAVAQMTSTPSVSANLATAVKLIKRAQESGASMLFLPEATDFIAPAVDVLSLSEPLKTGAFLVGLRQAAKDNNIFVNVGIHEFPPSPDVYDGRVFNTNVVISADGELVGDPYRKRRLFDVDLAPTGPTIEESNTTSPGTRNVAPVSTPVGRLGLQTCFDMRFVQASNELVQQGAEALAYPSAFAVNTGAAHWEVLLRARAIENQCYVFGSAQAGEHFPGRRSYGHAMIVDPWGTVVSQCPDAATADGSLAFAEIDTSLVQKVRREMPMGW